MMLGGRAPQKRGKARQFAEREVHAKGARAAAIRRDAGAKIGGQRRGIDKIFERELRMKVRDDRPRRDLLSLRRDDAGGAALLHQNLADLGARANFDPARGAGARHRLRDRAHAPDRVAPDALFAVRLAKTMVQKHVGRARGIGAGVSSDDPVEAEDRLHRIALEPLVEEVARGASEDLDAIPLPFQPERAQAVCDFGRIEQGAKIGDEPLSRRHVGCVLSASARKMSAIRSSRAS